MRQRAMASRTLRWVQRSQDVALDEVCPALRMMSATSRLWPTHLLLLGRPAFLQHQRVQRTGRGMQVPLREVEIASGFFQIVMA